MDIRIFTEPQVGATYDAQLAAARCAEAAGFSAYFRSDHYQAMGAAATNPTAALPGPTDAWITLAGIARETSQIRLGTLMTAGTFRYPGSLAISVAQIDAMSNGRVELGLGAGWYETEHLSYGIPFPATFGERLDRLEEQLEIMNGLWTTPTDKTFSFSGVHYNLQDSPALPKPIQTPHPPLIVGGRGLVRTPKLAARFAAEHNSFFDPSVAPVMRDALDAACVRLGRDPSTLLRSSVLPTVCGENDEDIARRLSNAFMPRENLIAAGGVGRPDDLAAQIAMMSQAGYSRVYLQLQDLRDLEQIQLLGEQLLPLVTDV